LWRQYRQYQQRKQERVQRLQQQAEEVQVTTIEGWTVADIAKELEKKGLTSAKRFGEVQESFDLTDYPLIKQNKPAKADLEGFLFPDTYRFNKTSTPEMLVEKMLIDFTQRVEGIGVTAGKSKYTIAGYEQYPLSFYEVLTLASIIEKESGGSTGSLSLDEERAIVAGVFYNRLAIGKALESDATVNYITGKNTPGVSNADTEINSPYNTYKYPGLPPGPICSPSLSSIKAALNPRKTDYYYFFHKQPSGEVVFSKTFEEHRRKRAE
jgi:UPF0755 protein